MFMTSSYQLLKRDGDVLWCRYLAAVEYCPQCGSVLLQHDRRKRIVRHFGGSVNHIIVRRMFCPICRRLHVELPDILLPYKQYESDVIEAVIDGSVTEEDERTIDGPTKVSMKYWIAWLQSNAKHISDLYIKSLYSSQPQSSPQKHHATIPGPERHIISPISKQYAVMQLHSDCEVHLPASFLLLYRYGAGWLSAGISLIYNSGFSL